MADQNVLNRQNLLEVVKSTRDAIILDWDKNGEIFIDKNYLQAEGMIPHSIGLTSVLLLMVAFSKEEEVFPESEIKKINEKVVKMLNKLIEMEKREGFSISPYKTAEETQELFGEFGYTDTITWVLSSCILARYAQRKGKLVLSANLQNQIFELLGKSFSTLIKGQREDGTWGFRADKGAYRSLYFTYAANASIADFYNYVLGEIENVEITNEGEDKIRSKDGFIDKELIAYLEANTDIKDVKKTIDEARAKLQLWLIKDCLPLLPKISECARLTEEENKRLGVGSQLTQEYRGTNYFNLYYAYYVIDLFVDSSADLRYGEMVEDKEQLDALIAYYRENEMFSEANDYYFFSKKNIENAKGLCSEYIAQAIHATRTNYFNAARTGSNFWDGNKSELNVIWGHDAYAVRQEISELNVQIKEPALIPMALRVNTQYCYYISNKEDKVIDDLFEKISKDRYFGTPDTGIHVINLWDDQSYSLPITERSIEAIIDAYDYVLKFESKEKETSSGNSEIENYFAKLVASQIAKSEKPSFDEKTIEKIIAKKVEEEVAKKLATVEINLPTPTANGTGLSDEALVAKIEEIISCMSNTPFIRPNSEEQNEKLAFAIMSLYEQTQTCVRNSIIAKQKFVAKTRNTLPEDLYDVEDEIEFRSYVDGADSLVSTFESKYPAIFGAIVSDVKTKGDNFLMDLYNAIKNLTTTKK